jgi:response regulator RpfG family c-di-GMP phosphodiesterase
VSVEEFMAYLESNKAHGYCKVAILGVHDTTEQFEMIGRLTKEIKKIDSRIGIILVCTPDKMEEIKKIIPSGVDAYIPKNANAILRLHNAVKKLLSEHGINNFRKRRNLSFYALIGFVILFIILIIIARLELPQYF